MITVIHKLNKGVGFTMTLVTGVITTHKRKPEMVERALLSIINQTHKNMEIFVVDDSPSDYELRPQVRAMVESYSDKNVTYIAHEKCMGACAARNTALEKASGEYISYLDDDDEWKKEKIERLLTGFTNDDIALVYCGYEVVHDNNHTVNKSYPVDIRANTFDKLMEKNYIGSTSFPLIKTTYLREIDGFDVLMPAQQDLDVWLRLCSKYKANYVNDCLITYHFHEGEQITTNPKKKIGGIERINGKYKEYLNKHRIAYYNRTVRFIPFYISDKQYVKAFKIWATGVCKCPEKVKDNIYYLLFIIKHSTLNLFKR